MNNKLSAKELKEARERLKELRPFTPYVSEQEHGELSALLASHGSSLARVDGAAFGLAVTLNANPEAVVPLLKLDEVLSPQEQERVTDYARAVWERVDREAAEDLSVNPELLTEVAGAEAWLTGLSWGVRIVPEKMVILLGELGQAVLGESATRVSMTVMSFMELENQYKSPEVMQDINSVRQQILGSMEKAAPEIRANLLQIILQDLFNGFTVVNMVPKEVLNSVVQGEALGQRPSESIRREGRKVRPNEACPCGSGKKYKKCHGAPGAPALPEV